MSASVGIVVPAYRPDVSLLSAYIDALHREIEPETIRVELDAPSSDTVEALEATGATINAVAHRRGKGAAISDGFEALDTDVLAFADADGSTPAVSVAAVVDEVKAGADLAVGSRRHPNADVRSHQTVLRQRLGDVFAWLGRRLLPVQLRDYQCGAKALTRVTWEVIRDHLYEPGFAWDIEVVGMTGALGYEISEVPVIWEDHPESTVNTASAIPELFSALLAVRKRSNALREGGPTADRTNSQATKPLVEREP